MTSGPIFRMQAFGALGCLGVRWDETFSADQCRDFFDTLSVTPFFRTCVKMFHDARGCNLSVGSDEMVRAARLPYVESAREGPLRIAILVETDVAFGMLRIMASMRAENGVEIRVFRDYDDGARWLELPPHDGEIFDLF